MDKFLKRYKLSKVTQEETENKYNPICTKDIEFVTEYLLTKKAPSLEGFTGKLYKTCKK